MTMSNAGQNAVHSPSGTAGTPSRSTPTKSTTVAASTAHTR
jgi:hypothetical protein